MIGACRRVLRRLRDETRDLHQEAEHYVRILDASAGLADYKRYLLTMVGFHVPLERAFCADPALEAVGFKAQARSKAHLFERDLASLGATRTTWPLCTVLPDVSTLPRALGAAYVLEGSTLGGRYILSRLPVAIAAVRATSTAFLTGYGEATGDQWRAFGAIIERTILSDTDEQLTLAGARDTFSRLIDWLARHEVRTELPVRGIA